MALNDATAYQPLYRQIYDAIVTMVAEGKWRPGEALPSEYAFAADLGVSQGTVRKVLNTLAAEGVLERRQGKGTYLAENTRERALFRFFRFVRPGGQRVVPESAQSIVRRRKSRAVDRVKLDLASADSVIEIARIRLIGEVPAIRETIVIPAALFPGLEKVDRLPNTLYSLFQSDYGIHIASVREEISAVAAEEEDASALHVALGSPLLQIDRVAMSLGGQKVEWRLSRCVSRDLNYSVTLP